MLQDAILSLRSRYLFSYTIDSKIDRRSNVGPALLDRIRLVDCCFHLSSPSLPVHLFCCSDARFNLMASLPATQLLPLSRTFSGNSCPARAFPPSLSYSCRTVSAIQQSVSSSKFNTKPAQAILSTSSVTDASDIGERTSTLREICLGCVPEHVLRRRVIYFFAFFGVVFGLREH